MAFQHHLRFGKIHDVTGPGFHGKMPFGIDSVQKGEVKAELIDLVLFQCYFVLTSFYKVQTTNDNVYLA